MPEFCTCGAQLPEDARFCHKCGKPQREEPNFDAVEEAEPVAVPPLPAAASEPAPINLRNGPAVVAALLAGLVGLLLYALLRQFGVIGLIAGGVLAVQFYRRRTGQRLSMMNGARLGWMTGLMCVPFLLLVTALLMLSPEFTEQMRRQLDGAPLSQAEINQVIETLSSRPGKVAMLVVTFLLATLPPTFGGAIGAKLLGRS